MLIRLRGCVGWSAPLLFAYGWLFWGLTSQSTIFQSYRDGAIASWVINQYFRGVKCLAQGHNTAAVGLEPRTSRSGVRHSTTEPPRSPVRIWLKQVFSWRGSYNKCHTISENKHWQKLPCIKKSLSQSTGMQKAENKHSGSLNLEKNYM